MQILIIGGTGLLGKALVQEWYNDEVVATGSKQADIRDGAQVRKLFTSCSPDWTILAAAYTDVDGCERNPKLAHEINCVGAINVARAARDVGSRLMLISTDYVFDGLSSSPYEVDDPVAPVNVYGRSKADAEAEVRRILPGSCVVRTARLFGAERDCFPSAILTAAQQNELLSVVSDQWGCPTFNHDLARAIIELVRRDAMGTIHVTNEGECTWFQFANEILRVGDLPSVRIQSISTGEFHRPAARPKYSVLSSRSLRAYGLSMRPWQEALRGYFEERMGKGLAKGKTVRAT
jgi:dTDP-4-dehydrorhamnose reductase